MEGRDAINDARRWKAVLSRDVRWNGRFVYAVRSTGIYCRPSCPSRRPHRDQVVFFELPEGAERVGFRPCRRCRPHGAAYDAQLEKVRQAICFIHARIDVPPTLAEMSAHVGVSPFHLQRAFKKVLGIPPRQYADARRLMRFKEMLRQGNPLAGAMYDAGYGSSSRLYEHAGSQLGMTPGTYRRGGEGTEISYAITRSPLGRLLVAATRRGVCAVKLGSSEATLTADLRREFPAAIISRNSGALKGPVDALLRQLKGEEPHGALPLDVRGTAFQRRVWQHLKTIPEGRTASYGEIARALGRPKGARAVARACATNPVAIIVPCHRVVRAGGGLGGYRWGVERKRTLLKRERERARRQTARKS